MTVFAKTAPSQQDRKSGLKAFPLKVSPRSAIDHQNKPPEKSEDNAGRDPSSYCKSNPVGNWNQKRNRKNTGR